MTDPYYPEHYEPQSAVTYPVQLLPDEMTGAHPSRPPPPPGRDRGSLLVAVLAALIVGLSCGFAIGHFVGNESGSSAFGPAIATLDTAPVTPVPTHLRVIGAFTLTDASGYSHGRHCHGV